MVEPFKDFIIEAIEVRAAEVDNEIAGSNVDYKIFTQEIIRLEAELEKHLGAEGKVFFADYKNMVLQRNALTVSLLYRQGFSDFADLVSGVIKK